MQLAEFREHAVGAHARQRQRWLGARRECQRPARAHAFDQSTQEAEERGVLDAVDVVEHDQSARHLARVERVDDLGRDRALRFIRAAAEHREQRLGRRAPGWVVRFEGRERALEQASQVVARVRRNPGECVVRGQPARLGRKQRRLAVAGGRAEQHDGARGERLRDLRVQAIALDEHGARARGLDLGAGERHDRPRARVTLARRRGAP
jgi:hypothetical protein